MAREERKQQINNLYEGVILKNDLFIFIDKVYDDFESRLCENCEYLVEDNNDIAVWTECRCKDNPLEYTTITQQEAHTFGCNKYKRK